MYRERFQGGLLTLLSAGGHSPLNDWEVKKRDGYLQIFLDQDIKAMVLEIGGTNVSTAYLSCPKGNKEVLGIAMPFLIMVIKNLNKYFTFEVTILDDTNVRRRFRVANFQSCTKILQFSTAMPICLSEGWNQVQFNLADFTQRAYQRQYVETQRLKINANVRIRRIYFAERLMTEEELPPEYRLFFPLPPAKKKPCVCKEEKYDPHQVFAEETEKAEECVCEEGMEEPAAPPSASHPDTSIKAGIEASEGGGDTAVEGGETKPAAGGECECNDVPQVKCTCGAEDNKALTCTCNMPQVEGAEEPGVTGDTAKADDCVCEPEAGDPSRNPSAARASFK